MLLRDGAPSQDVLRGAFHAHVLLHLLDSVNGRGDVSGGLAPSLPQPPRGGGRRWPWQRRPPAPSVAAEVAPGGAAWEGFVTMASEKGGVLFEDFAEKAKVAGWKPQLTMLNPQETRLMSTP